MDAIDELPVFPTQRQATRAVLALRFAALVTTAFSLSWLLAASLIRWVPTTGTLANVPVSFVASTLSLAAGSYALVRAVRWVRVERQKPFRRWLIAAVAISVLFTGVQSFGLFALFPADRSVDLAQTGSVPFAIAVVTMHALHVIVSQLFLGWIVVQAFNDRYDHEFYKPVGYCAAFWHFLGFVWLVILGGIMVAL